MFGNGSLNGGARKMRIGILLEGGHITGMDRRVFECVQNATRKFKALGAEVEEISIPEHLDMALLTRGLRCLFLLFFQGDQLTVLG
jgi:amidase